MPDSVVDPVAEFLVAATTGSLARARALLAEHPTIAGANLYTAAVLGDDALVRGMLANDAARARTSGGPNGWDPLTYLCFSRFLAQAPVHAEGFVRAADALIAAGAGVHTGFMTPGGSHPPEWECVLHGAAGVAHHPELTRLLLAHGADANDGEVTYHAPETRDNRALAVLVEHGTLTADSLATMLLRKCDWHDAEGVAYLLAHGADPNRMTMWKRTALYQAVVRDNDVATIARLLDAGGDPHQGMEDVSCLVQAARDGRRAVLELFVQRGYPLAFEGPDAILAACALGDAARAHALATTHPADHNALVSQGGERLTEFAGEGNAEGVGLLLELGVAVDARDVHGNGYWDIARDSTALHVAAWRAQHAVVRLLIERGADVNARDAAGRSPLMLAVKACVDSYWTARRQPDSVAALVLAGADREDVVVPCGYDDVDALLTR